MAPAALDTDGYQAVALAGANDSDAGTAALVLAAKWVAGDADLVPYGLSEPSSDVSSGRTSDLTSDLMSDLSDCSDRSGRSSQPSPLPSPLPTSSGSCYRAVKLDRDEIRHRMETGHCTYCNIEGHTRQTCALGRIMRKVPKRVLDQRLRARVCPLCGDPDGTRHSKQTCPQRQAVQAQLDGKARAARDAQKAKAAAANVAAARGTAAKKRADAGVTCKGSVLAAATATAT